MLRFIISKRTKGKKQNNRGFTMVELVVTFAILGIFMVAATRIISYTVTIYYAARGSSYGLEVSNMISEKIVGQLEGACNKNTISENSAPPISEAEPSANPIITKGTGFDRIKFCDSTGSIVTIGVDAEGYVVIHYDEVTSGPIKYDAVDWKFDQNAYMGYVVSGLNFEQAGSDYPENVVKMTIMLKSDRYGEYTSYYYLKCTNVDKINCI